MMPRYRIHADIWGGYMSNTLISKIESKGTEKQNFMKSIQKRITDGISEYFLKFRATEHTFMILVAIIIGFLGGMGAVGIQYLIKLFQELFW